MTSIVLDLRITLRPSAARRRRHNRYQVQDGRISRLDTRLGPAS
jgi:hypothetical protein